MKRDRTAICKIISDMLDNPNDLGIYPTTKAYERIEAYIESERMQAVGWTYSEACSHEDIRKVNVPFIINKATNNLDVPLEERHFRDITGL